VPDGLDDLVDAGVVEAGESFLKIHRQAFGDAGGKAQDPALRAFSELAICLADLPRCGFC
jgi:hypothetical protein